MIRWILSINRRWIVINFTPKERERAEKFPNNSTVRCSAFYSNKDYRWKNRWIQFIATILLGLGLNGLFAVAAIFASVYYYFLIQTAIANVVIMIVIVSWVDSWYRSILTPSKILPATLNDVTSFRRLRCQFCMAMSCILNANHVTHGV